MSEEHFGRVGGRLRFHLEKLDNFAQEVLAEPALLRDAVPGKMAFDERTAFYASTGLFTYERERVASHKAAGCTKYRNVQHSQESCQTHGNKIGCQEITNKGIVPIDSEPDVGKRACGPKDLCTWEFIW